MRKILDLQYNEYCELDVYLPETDGFATVVYFHGGGLETGDKRNASYCEIAESFVKKGYGFVSANYRMYPDGARFPQFLEDAADAVGYVKKKIGEYGGNGGIYIAGQSAGAYIASMLCFDTSYLAKVGMDTKDVLGWIIDSAQMTTHYNVLKKESGCSPLAQKIDERAPLYFIDENTRFSRMILFFYEEDVPCRKEQNLLLYQTVKCFVPQADIVYRQLPFQHCYGSSHKDEDGEYRFVKETFSWLEEENEKC